MEVILRPTKSEMKPREGIFENVLLKMGVPLEVIHKLTIIVEFRDMIPDGGMSRVDDYEFTIYLRNLRAHCSFNETIAHELKHIATEILKPKKFRTDGKKSGPYKWEEMNCSRAEKRWGKLDYFK